MKNMAAILVLIVIAGCTSLPEGAPREAFLENVKR